MKVLVKSLLSRKYLTNSGTWTADASQAREFNTSTDAVLFCSIHAVEDSELVTDTSRIQVGFHFVQPSLYESRPLDD